MSSGQKVDRVLGSACHDNCPASLGVSNNHARKPSEQRPSTFLTVTMADIAGNAPAYVKELFAHPPLMLGMIDAETSNARGFGKDVMPLLSITEASMSESVEAPSKKDARVVCKLVVTDGA